MEGALLDSSGFPDAPLLKEFPQVIIAEDTPPGVLLVTLEATDQDEDEVHFFIVPVNSTVVDETGQTLIDDKPSAEATPGNVGVASRQEDLASLFTIGQTTGELFVREGKRLDFEDPTQAAGFILGIYVVDTAIRPLGRTQTVYVRVLPVNEPPEWPQPQISAVVPACLLPGQVAITLPPAFDPEGEELNFELTSSKGPGNWKLLWHVYSQTSATGQLHTMTEDEAVETWVTIPPNEYVADDSLEGKFGFHKWLPGYVKYQERLVAGPYSSTVVNISVYLEDTFVWTPDNSVVELTITASDMPDDGVPGLSSSLKLVLYLSPPVATLYNAATQSLYGRYLPPALEPYLASTQLQLYFQSLLGTAQQAGPVLPAAWFGLAIPFAGTFAHNNAVCGLLKILQLASIYVSHYCHYRVTRLSGSMKAAAMPSQGVQLLPRNYQRLGHSWPHGTKHLWLQISWKRPPASGVKDAGLMRIQSSWIPMIPWLFRW